MNALKFYCRLERFTVERVLNARSREVRAIVLFGKVAIMWDAPDHGCKVDFK